MAGEGRRGVQVGGSGKSSPSHEPRSTVATAAVAAGEAQCVCDARRERRHGETQEVQ